MTNIGNKILIKSASWMAVIFSAIILVLKFYSWLASDSQAILASLVDSMLDISSSIINLIVVTIALKPPDHNHRFGHEKFQDLAIFSQGIFFLASGLFSLISASRSVYFMQTMSEAGLALASMYLCVALTIILVLYQNIVVNKTGSKIIAMDKVHYVSDLLTNVAAIISIHLSQKFWFIDGAFGILISLYIIYNSYKLFKLAVSNLVDQEFSDEDKKKVLAIISKYKIVQGVHEFKSRYAANKAFIQFHLEMDGSMTLFSAHDIADKIANDILEVFPGGEVTIHQDPSGVEAHVNYREPIR